MNHETNWISFSMKTYFQVTLKVFPMEISILLMLTILHYNNVNKIPPSQMHILHYYILP